MFICPKCKSSFNLPKCDACNFEVAKSNNIWQLSDMPNIITSGDDKYIGYEHIAECYSGSRKLLIEERDSLIAREISCFTGEGVLLDLACGDGCFTVPCASFGTRIIAGDISNSMLALLQDKADYNKIPLDNVTLCRMNAYTIPLENQSIDSAVVNSVLHLVSNPEKILLQTFRVLKKGGCFICTDDSPGANDSKDIDNSLYNEIVNGIYSSYWSMLMKHNITPAKYNWKFNRSILCNSLFEKKSEKLITRGNLYERTLRDGFLPRFIGRGFSDQTDVPEQLHNNVIKELLFQFKSKYGENFADISYRGIEQDWLLTVYTK